MCIFRVLVSPISFNKYRNYWQKFVYSCKQTMAFTRPTFPKRMITQCGVNSSLAKIYRKKTGTNLSLTSLTEVWLSPNMFLQNSGTLYGIRLRCSIPNFTQPVKIMESMGNNSLHSEVHYDCHWTHFYETQFSRQILYRNPVTNFIKIRRKAKSLILSHGRVQKRKVGKTCSP